MGKKNNKARLIFFFTWMFATISGSSAMGLFLAYNKKIFDENIWITLVIGLFLGIPQWFVLRQYSTKAKRWLIVNIFGWPAGLLIGYPLASFWLYCFFRPGFIILAVTIASILVAILQAPVYQIKNGSTIDLARVMAVALATLFGLIFGGVVLDNFYKFGSVMALVMASSACGILYGAVTGFILIENPANFR